MFAKFKANVSLYTNKTLNTHHNISMFSQKARGAWFFEMPSNHPIMRTMTMAIK